MYPPSAVSRKLHLNLLLSAAAGALLLASCVSDGADGHDGEDGHDGQNGQNGGDGTDGMDGADGHSPSAGIFVRELGRYETGVFNKSAAEIVAFDPGSKRAFVVDALASRVDVLDLSTPATPTLVDSLDAAAAAPARMLGAANSVSVHGGVIAIAIEADPKTDPGLVAFYDAATLALRTTVDVGALPDMVTFTPDGRYVLTANEGEPSADYAVDPEGSVSIIDISAGFGTPPPVRHATFTAFNERRDALRAAGVRIFGAHDASVAQDVEPEYIAVAKDGSTAWVTLQENDAIAVVDLATATVTDVRPLGFKNHAIPGNELDASDQDGAIAIRTWPIFGMYQPDGIASYQAAGATYLVTANEGDGRDYGTALKEEARIKDLTLDPIAFPDGATLKRPEQLGRLTVTNKLGDTDGDGDFDRLYALGGRSFSIWDAATGGLVYDSGNELEVRTAVRFGTAFNSDSTANGGDNRSDNKGPEPEGVALGTIDGSTYAFIGLERMSGIVVYDVTLPESPRFIQYVNPRHFGVAFDGNNPTQLSAAGDLGPEGLAFVAADKSPTGKPMLLVGNEVSGSTGVYEIARLPEE